MRQHYCSLCGNIHHNITFKCGYVCEDCIDYIKETVLKDETLPRQFTENSNLINRK